MAEKKRSNMPLLPSGKSGSCLGFPELLIHNSLPCIYNICLNFVYTSVLYYICSIRVGIYFCIWNNEYHDYIGAFNYS